jgi:signal transduction histidine kinase
MSNQINIKNSSVETKTLIIISALFAGVLACAWAYALNLQRNINSGKSTVSAADVRPLVEIEKLRNMAEDQISNSRAFFLLGSASLFDSQKKEKQALLEALSQFEKHYSLPKVPESIKQIETLEQQQQEFFDQAMEFRAKQTESKIVGQFYQAKTNPIRAGINKALDEIAALHTADFERAQENAKEAAAFAKVQIPFGMTWLTSSLALLFLGMVFLVVRMLRERPRHVAERNRLYDEAKKAVLARDEVMVAISQDFLDPLDAIAFNAQIIKTTPTPANINDGVDLIKSSVTVIESSIQDILDQKKSEQGQMTLRLDQLGIDGVLDDAKLMLQPFAKQKDVRIEINAVNPPVLAFMDRERVMRVLSNLIGNAIKFSPRQSKVIVKVRSDQQFVFISVKDSGPGIPEKQLPQIFDQFWQARKDADQGPGIGLAIVKTIIEAHGGSVHVESHMGHGSTFTFSLPRRRPLGAHLGKPATPAVRLTRRGSAQIDGFT